MDILSTMEEFMKQTKQEGSSIKTCGFTTLSENVNGTPDAPLFHFFNTIATYISHLYN